jgi:hypothetical protein
MREVTLALYLETKLFPYLTIPGQDGEHSTL